MHDCPRNQLKYPITVGVAFIALVWILYGVRLIWGVGPAHDYEGKQAPAFHYLVCALVVTGTVVVWITVRAIMLRRQKHDGQPPEGQA